jgi:hypothetical protein
MSGRFILISVDGTRELYAVHDRPGPVSLDKLQKAVGGYIERVKVRYEGRLRDAYVNEDGYNMPINLAASDITEYDQYIHGPMVIWVPDPKKPKAVAS